MGVPPPVELALFVIFLIVLILPFTLKTVEENLEAFLLIMGGLAVTVAGKWTLDLVRTAVEEPITKGIVPAVFAAGLVFFYGRHAFAEAAGRLLGVIPLPVTIFGLVVILGLLSSVITAIIAALVLVEIVHLLPLEPKAKTSLIVIACFSIGLGAVLTPLGEPLSTITVVKLAGPPYHAGFWYLFEQLGVPIALGVVGLGLFAAFYVSSRRAYNVEALEIKVHETGRRHVLARALRVYVFVAALFLLGAGMEVVVSKYFTQLPVTALFWLNMLSAILDNATLTAAEIAPSMTQAQINAALLGLLVSGGMLIPGNIPNIISASKLRITSAQWARLGVPLGLAINSAYFAAIYF